MEFHFIIILWIATSNPIYTAANVDAQQPQICIKENSVLGENVLINTTAKSFKDFVRNSDIFVDKSLLVNLVTENVSFISLTYPKKWGKTINLDMLKTFLEIEVDSKGKAKPMKATWNFKFFKDGEIVHENGTSVKLKQPPMIHSNQHVIDSYLGQYPVIYVDLSDFEPVSRSFHGFFESFQKRIATAFQRHEYLVEAFESESGGLWTSGSKKLLSKKFLEKFNQYRMRKISSKKDMIISLEFLGSILKSYFNRRVYILIDDYDALVRKLYLEEPLVKGEAEKIMNFFLEFVSCTFEINNENVHMGIVTGIFDLDVFTNFTGSFATLNYNLFNKNTRPSFGFTQLEVNRMLECYSVDEKTINTAIEYYGGHRVNDSSKIVVHDPWSFVNFANERKIQNFRPMAEAFRMISGFRPNGEYFVSCNIIVINDTIDVRFRNLTFNKADLILLNDIMNEIYVSRMNDEMLNLIFKYFYAIGYFTLHASKINDNSRISTKIKFSNNYIADTCRKECGFDFAGDLSKKAKRIAEIIFQYLQHDEYKEVKSWARYTASFTTNELHEMELTEEFEKLHRTCIPGDQASVELKDFYSLHVLMLQQMKLLFNYDGHLHPQGDENSDRPQPYISLQKYDRSAIIEFECKKEHHSDEVLSSARRALNRAKRCSFIFQDEPFIRINFVGVGLYVGDGSTSTEVQIDTNLLQSE